MSAGRYISAPRYFAVAAWRSARQLFDFWWRHGVPLRLCAELFVLHMQVAFAWWRIEEQVR